jgi:hypothetical protein
MALTVATIDEAIEKLLTGAQSVSVDGMSYTQTSLNDLRAMRNDLLRQTGSLYGFGKVIMRGPRP